MPINAKTRGEIEKKARLFEARKARITERIQENIRVAVDKLRSAEKELLDEVEIEFGQNPFAEFLGNNNDPTDEELKEILGMEVPRSFGPDEESFYTLCKEIDSFKSWQEKRKRMCIDPLQMIPKNLKCGNITSNSATLTWDNVECDCIYEIGLKSPTLPEEVIYNSFEPQFALQDLEPETKYVIRVRTVTSQNIGNRIWSNPITLQTEHSFSGCFWKECPDNVNKSRKYSVNEENPRIATKIDGSYYCTIIGNTPLPLNKVTSWSIKVLGSWENDGSGIYIGVAPFDIDQNEDENLNKSGWYFGCFYSALRSGPPHNYRNKEYGPRKEDGEYVYTGDSAGVVMDTAKGELSFVLNGVNLGVAYEGIPLDKPLVPCVILRWEGDSVKLLI